MRVLLIEDDQTLGDGLSRGLRIGGHTVDWLTDGQQAAGALEADDFDAVVLDLALPRRSGLDVLAHWRDAGHSTPVLVLTAYEGTRNCVKALDEGADDFVVKPVELEELEARLRAVARRAGGQAGNTLTAGALAFDRSTRSAWLDGEPLELSGCELALLETLMERAERPVTHDRLETRLYGWGDSPESNSVQVMIHHLRRKIGAARIQTVRGIGYRLLP